MTLIKVAIVVVLLETRGRDIVERTWEFEWYFFCTNCPCEGGETFQAKPHRAFDSRETRDPHVLVGFGMHG